MTYLRPLSVAVLILTCAGLSRANSATRPAEHPQAITLTAEGGDGVTFENLSPAKPTKGRPAALTINKRDETDGPRRSVTFSPAIQQAGYYELWIKTPGGVNWPAMAKGMGVKIIHAEGTNVLQARPQLSGPWLFFGTWQFKPDAAKVVISNEGVVSTATIEAVQFIPTKQPPQKRGPRPLPPAKDDFDVMRDRWLDRMAGPADLDESDQEVREMFLDNDHLAIMLWTTMLRSPERRAIWGDMNVPNNDYSAGGREAEETFERLRRLALAYATAAPHYGYGAKMRGNPQLKQDILDALTFMMDKSWNEQTKEAAIGWLALGTFIPRYNAETLIFLGEVPEELKRRHLETALRLSPTPLKHTGANRLFWVTSHAALGILAKDADRIDLARKGMDEPLSFNERKVVEKNKKPSPDGMHRDGSFIQHGDQPYNHGYGTGMVKQLGDTIALFEGSRWQVSDEQKQNLVQYLHRGVIPLSFRGQWFRRVTGRAVSSFKDERPTIETNLASVAPIAPKADQDHFLGVLKAMQLHPQAVAYADERAARVRRGFGRRPPAMDFLRRHTAWRVERDPTVKPVEWYQGARVFHFMDMVAHHRANWAAELSMSSTRIATHESFFGNNKKGWYLGDGMLRLHTLDYRLYLDNYWPTHDPYRLPGTTVDTRDRSQDFGADAANYGGKSKSDFAGGAELNERYAVAGMILMGRQSSLVARKAYFMFDDGVLCVGTGINATDGRAIETTVEQMRLDGEGNNPLLINGQPQPTTLDYNATLDKVAWAHLAGNTPDSGMGYWFPQPASVHAKREARTGAWTDIGPESKNDAAKYTRNYAALWFDHGKDPKDATYQYMVLPGMTAEQTKAWVARPTIEVLAATPAVSAARDTSKNLTAAVFFEDADAAAAGIASDKKACVLVWETDKEIHVAVSDPTQKNTGVINLTIDRKARSVAESDEAVQAKAGDKLTLVVKVGGSFGQTYRATFAK